MSTATLNRTNYKTFAKSEKRVSFVERFCNYITENSAEIVSGLMMLNGDTNAYRVYTMLKK